MDIEIICLQPNCKETNDLVIKLHHPIAFWRARLLLVTLLIPANGAAQYVIKILSCQLSDKRSVDIGSQQGVMRLFLDR